MSQRLNPQLTAKTQDDPHKLRRLCRPTGPQRATMREIRAAKGHKFRSNYAMAVYKDPNSSLHDLTSAVETMEKVLRVRRRVFGHCPRTTREARKTEVARAVLAERHARETPTDELDEVENA